MSEYTPSPADGDRGARGRVARAALMAASLALGVYLLLPLLAGLQATAETVARTSWWLPWCVLALEAASFAAYGELQLLLLAASGQRPRRGLIQRAVIAGAALSKTLPGGAATSMVMMVRMLSRRGLDGPATAVALGATGAISWAVIALTLPLASILAIAGGATGAVALGSVFLALAVLAAVGLTPLVIRRPERVGRAARRVVAFVVRGRARRLVDPGRIGAFVTQSLRSAARLVRDRRVLFASGRMAAAGWLFDIAVLVVFAAALGEGTPLLPIPLGYVVAQLVTLVPITPGGVGIIEATLAGMLIGAGAPAGEATAIVLAWRLVSHWLPIAVGLVMLPLLGRSARADDSAPA